MILFARLAGQVGSPKTSRHVSEMSQQVKHNYGKDKSAWFSNTEWERPDPEITELDEKSAENYQKLNLQIENKRCISRVVRPDMSNNYVCL